MARFRSVGGASEDMKWLSSIDCGAIVSIVPSEACLYWCFGGVQSRTAFSYQSGLLGFFGFFSLLETVSADDVLDSYSDKEHCWSGLLWQRWRAGGGSNTSVRR